MTNNEMSLYSINKASMSQIEPYDGIALNRLCYKMAKWMLEEKRANYYMKNRIILKKFRQRY